MGNLLQMNPFTDEGRINIKTYITQNRKLLTIVLIGCILTVVASMYIVWSGDTASDSNRKQYKPDFPSPIIGDGPYGYGMYLPPVDRIISAI